MAEDGHTRVLCVLKMMEFVEESRIKYHMQQKFSGGFISKLYFLLKCVEISQTDIICHVLLFA